MEVPEFLYVFPDSFEREVDGQLLEQFVEAIRCRCNCLVPIANAGATAEEDVEEEVVFSQ